MRSLFVAVLLAALVFIIRPAAASLPYYNPDLGYTIWLPGGWAEAPQGDLARYAAVRDGLGVLSGGGIAGYSLEGADRTCLLVSTLLGRVVSPAAIANFNRFVVKSLLKGEARSTVHLRKAHFLSEKNMLRLEMDIPGRMTSVVYIVYTRTGMLKFTGLAREGDARSLQAIDRAVATLYLDHGLGQ